MSDDAAQGNLGEDMLVFVRRVRGEAALERDVDAEVLARATMRALGAQITDDASTGLTAGLPEELVTELDAHSAGDQADFDRRTFLDRVAAELGGDGDRAGDRDRLDARVHAVLAVVREWAPAGRLEDTLARLPSPLAAMFA